MRVNNQAGGMIQHGFGGGAAEVRTTVRSTSCHGGDRAVGHHLAHDIIARIRDEHITRGVHRNASGMIQLGSNGQSIVAGSTGRQAAGDGRDRPGTAAGKGLPVAAVDGRDGLRPQAQRGRRQRGDPCAQRANPEHRGPVVERHDAVGRHGVRSCAVTVARNVTAWPETEVPDEAVTAVVVAVVAVGPVTAARIAPVLPLKSAVSLV